MKLYDKTKQFSLTSKEYVKKLDYLNWDRFFHIMKAVGTATRILEIGPGEGTIKRLLELFVEYYETLDVNTALNPTHHADIRERKQHLIERYDCVIAADILEHIPFGDLSSALANIYAYCAPLGKAIVTIPHRSHYLFFMTSLARTHVSKLLRLPTLKRVLGKKVAIDPDHEWEIGDAAHTITDVEKVIKNAGFVIEKREKLMYVDFWILQKHAI